MQFMPRENRPQSPRILWAKRLLRLYPAAWRERYGEEMLAILEEHPPTVGALLDLFLNLCDAHLHVEIVPIKIPAKLKQFHSSITTIFCTCLLFCLLASSTSFPFTIDNIFSAGTLDAFNNLIHGFDGSFLVLPLFLLLLAGGLPLLVFACWQAIRARHIQNLALYFIGLCSLFIASSAGTVIDTLANPLYSAIYRFFGGDLSSIPPVNTFGLILWLSRISPGYDLFVCIGVCALWIALQQSVPTTRLTKFTLIPGILIPIFMLAYLFKPVSHLLFNPLSQFLTSFLVRGGFIIGHGIFIITYIRLDIPSLLITMLVAWYGLLRLYQARRIPTLKTE